MKSLSFPKMLLIVLLLAGFAASAYITRANPSWPVNEVAVDGDISMQQRTAVFELLSDGGVRDLPMIELQSRVQDLSWVNTATLARRWPDALMVTVVAEKPMALWNDDAYLNDQGQVFSSPFVNEKRLPQLFGPEGEQEVVMAQYLQLNNMLFKGGQFIDQLTLDGRGNWKFKSNLEIDVLLGKTALMERVQRLLQITDYIEVKGQLEQIRQIDTRYVNGAAVAWHDQSVVAQTHATELKLATNHNSQRESKL